VLFALAVVATLTIFIRDPLVGWEYALGIFLLAGDYSARKILAQTIFRFTVSSAALAVISLWGFAQLATGATVDRYATWDAALRTMALGATAWVAANALRSADLRRRFLEAFTWFGFALSSISVLAYFTAPGRVLWFFPSPYPDVWGPFLSRNDFAGFMELSFPVALWLSSDRGGIRVPLWVPAWMLAAGLAAGSRAGAILLLAEAGVILALLSRRRTSVKFALLAALLAGVAGAGTLLGRFAEKDPFRYRREMAASTVSMILDRPWQGSGLGTYPHVYPAYATFDLGGTVEHAHNYWLEWAAEGGIPFALVWLILALAISVPAVRSVWGIGIMAVFLHALVDYPFARFGLTAWNFSLIGALSAASLRGVRSARHSLSVGENHRETRIMGGIARDDADSSFGSRAARGCSGLPGDWDDCDPGSVPPEPGHCP
jgi:O-antigen ligase